MSKGDEQLEKLISMAHKIADPYRFCCVLLSVLLVISILGNIYLYTKGSTVILDADDNIESDINQTNNQTK